MSTDSTAISQAIMHLAQGDIIAYPTDTLYGLGVDALNSEAIERLYELKDRNRKKPMSIMVQPDNWQKWADSVTQSTKKLAEKFFPGPITLIMNASDNVPKILTRYTNGTIGIRVPNHPACLELLHSFTNPIITTSANISSEPVAKSPDEIVNIFGDGVSYILDEGMRPGGIASTIIDVTNDEPLLLREGAIPEFAIWRTLK